MLGQKALHMQRFERARLAQRALPLGELGSGGLRSVHRLLLLSPSLPPGKTKPDESDLDQRSVGSLARWVPSALALTGLGGGGEVTGLLLIQKTGPGRSKMDIEQRKWDVNCITGGTGFKKGLCLV